MRFLLLSFLLLLTACAAPFDEKAPLELEAVSYSSLPGWGSDDLSTALPAMQRSCARVMKRGAGESFGDFEQAGSYGDWQNACNALFSAGSGEQLRSIIEQYFQPYEARGGSRQDGLFTGYYEASLRGARSKYGPYRYPLYMRPDDLIMVQLGDFREDLKGRRIAGRVSGGKLKPYENRTDIVAGHWPHDDKVLVWVDDPVDAFFVQIQGSGVVELDTGEVMRIGYAGQNGHVYYAIGRELIKREHLTKENVSMQSIRAWLEQNPNEADEVMNLNSSYVFFKESEQDGAIGGEGVVLTAGRSLAVDRSKIPYGIPLWVDIDPPLEDEEGLTRLMVAQDTGGAIRGAVRGDVYWGYGDRAEYLAGHMKSEGRYWLLLPK